MGRIMKKYPESLKGFGSENVPVEIKSVENVKKTTWKKCDCPTLKVGQRLKQKNGYHNKVVKQTKWRGLLDNKTVTL